MKRLYINKLKKVILVTAIILVVCYSFFYLGSSPTPSRRQLCADLSVYIEMKDCMAKESVTEILVVAFKPGETTRSEVNAAIGQYRYFTNKWFDYYKLHSTWFSRYVPLMFETSYHFSYDENDVFLGFTVED